MRWPWNTTAFRKSAKIDAKYAAILVGIPTAVILQLRKDRIFEVTNHALRPQIFQICDVERFLESLLLKTGRSPKPRPSDKTTISLRRLLLVSKFGNTNQKAQFIADYLNGSITPLGRFGDTTDDILFDKRAIKSFSRQSRINQDSHELSYADASVILKCVSGAIPSLVQMGYLRCAVSAGGRHPRISKQSVDEFHSKWASIKSINEGLGVFPVRIQRIADQKGIFRLSVAARKHCTEFCSFVQREDVAMLLKLVQSDIKKYGRQKGATAPSATPDV